MSLLDRFLRYVRVDTTAGDYRPDQPSSPGQLELGRLLVAELRQMGLVEVNQDSFGVVTATVPATVAKPAPTIAFCAHLDTSPETPGAGVRPQVIANYRGGDLVLPADPGKVIRVADCPELNELKGKTLITTDGTTLLGADDKAGVAVIMEAAAWWAAHPQSLHGPLRLLFTCDEEIGHGVDHLDLVKIAAAACYTLDGQAEDTIDVETFSADEAIVHVVGVNIHPSIGKGRMVNAARVAGCLVARLPRDQLAPEVTADREGFMHPYQVKAGVGEATIQILLRDFDTRQLAVQADLLRKLASEVERDFAGAKVSVETRTQYRNMAEGLARDPRAVARAEEALRRLGRKARRTIVRGGTDGSRLTELGLPTPNLSCGQHTPHSALEWACLEEMQGSVEWLVKLAEVWAEEP